MTERDKTTQTPFKGFSPRSALSRFVSSTDNSSLPPPPPPPPRLLSLSVLLSPARSLLLSLLPPFLSLLLSSLLSLPPPLLLSSSPYSCSCVSSSPLYLWTDSSPPFLLPRRFLFLWLRFLLTASFLHQVSLQQRGAGLQVVTLLQDAAFLDPVRNCVIYVSGM